MLAPDQTPADIRLQGTRLVFWLTLACLVFVLPISHTTALRSAAIAILIGLTIWEAVRGHIRIHLPLRWPWLIYAAVSLGSLAFAVDLDYSLKELRAEIMLSIILFTIGASWIRCSEDFGRLIKLVISGNILFIAGSAWNYFQQGSIGTGIAAWNSGVGNTSTTIVMVAPWLLIIAIKLSQGTSHKWILAALLLLIAANLGALLITLNRQGWLALLAAAIPMILLLARGLRGRKALAGIAIFLVLISAIGLAGFQLRANVIGASNDSPLAAVSGTAENDVRWRLWQFSLDAILQHPWTGGGFGREALKQSYPDYYNSRKSEGLPFWHAHNMVLNKGIQMGIPGILGFLLLWAALSYASAKELRNPELRLWAIAMIGMLASTFIKNMTDDFFYRHHAYLFWLICGAFLGLRQHRGRSRQHHAP